MKEESKEKESECLSQMKYATQEISRWMQMNDFKDVKDEKEKVSIQFFIYCAEIVWLRNFDIFIRYRYLNDKKVAIKWELRHYLRIYYP